MSDIQEYGMIVNDAEENKVMIGFFDSDDHAIRAFFTAPDEMQEIFSEISPSEMFLFYGYKDEGEFRIKEKIGLYTFDACNGNVMKFIEVSNNIKR